MPQSVSLVTFGGTGTLSLEADGGPETLLIVVLHTPTIDAAPSALTVSVLDALGTEDIVFTLEGQEVFRIEPDPDGNLDLATIPVPDLRVGEVVQIDAGTHTLVVTQGSAEGTVDFEVLNDPAELPEALAPDAPPVAVPGSVQPNGVLRWVFQDLMPGGLGSWIFPMNPEEADSPPFQRELTAKSTTASVETGGQFHITEDAYSPVEWSFQGYIPTETMREKMEEYADLNRRFYLHDHRGRAWIVVFQDLQLTPRLAQIWNGEYTNEGHDYEATVLVLDRDFVEVDYT